MTASPSTSRIDWIRDSRKRMRWSQTRLADHFCVSQATVSQWETGKTPPRDEDWQEMEELFGEPPPTAGPATAEAPAARPPRRRR